MLQNVKMTSNFKMKRLALSLMGENGFSMTKAQMEEVKAINADMEKVFSIEIINSKIVN